MVIGYIGNPTECTQTTIGTQDQGPTLLIISDRDDFEATYTGTYTINNYAECYQCYADDIPDDEAVGTIVLVVQTRRGFLRIPIKYLRKSMHPG